MAANTRRREESGAYFALGDAKERNIKYAGDDTPY